ncbi:hypothetical protein GGI42DRAFT_337732 [Trichoderma sp. SZMC 28013]
MNIVNHLESLRCYACNQPLPYSSAPSDSLYDLYLDQFQHQADDYQPSSQHETSPYPLAPLLPDPTPEAHQLLDATGWHHHNLLSPAESYYGVEGLNSSSMLLANPKWHHGRLLPPAPSNSEIEGLSGEEREAVLNLPEDEQFVILLRLERVPWREISVRYEKRFPKPVAHTALAMRIQRRKQLSPVLDRLLRSREKNRRR